MGLESPVTVSDAFFLGEDKVLSFVVYTEGTTLAEIQANPSANRQSITGWSLEWGLAQRADDDPLVRKLSGSGITITDAVQGELTVGLDSDDTAELAPGDYFHTLWRDNAGNLSVLAFGGFHLRQPIEQLP